MTSAIDLQHTFRKLTNRPVTLVIVVVSFFFFYEHYYNPEKTDSLASRLDSWLRDMFPDMTDHWLAENLIDKLAKFACFIPAIHLASEPLMVGVFAFCMAFLFGFSLIINAILGITMCYASIERSDEKRFPAYIIGAICAYWWWEES